MANKLVDESGLNQAMVEVNKTFIKKTETLFTFGDTPVQKGDTVSMPALYMLVSTLPTAGADTMNRIYLVPAGTTETGNIYAEYITVAGQQQTGKPANYKWEKLGEHKAEVDLTPYAKQADLNTLKGRVDGHDTTIAQHTQKLAEHTSAINTITTTIGQHTTKLSQLDYELLTTAAVTSLCNTIFGS